MDSLNYALVAEKLGIPLKFVVQNTAAVIIDGQVNEVISLIISDVSTSDKCFKLFVG